MPSHVHGAVEEAAVDLGLPLVVEKPLGVDAGTALPQTYAEVSAAAR